MRVEIGTLRMVRGSAAAAPLIDVGSVSIAVANVALAMAVRRVTAEPGRQARPAATAPVVPA